MGTVQRWLADATRTGVRVDTAAREAFERSVYDISSMALSPTPSRRGTTVNDVEDVASFQKTTQPALQAFVTK